MFKETMALIIPTKDRPLELGRLLESVSAQSVRPVQIIVVDGGEAPLGEVIKRFPGLPIDYAKSVPSLTAQRNLGIKMARPDATLIAFADDDVVFEERSIENMMKFWEAAPEDTGGAAFNITNQPYERPSFFEKFFLVNADRPSRILASGFQSKASFQDRTLRVDWLVGCSMVWRRRLFGEFLFDEWFSGYARYEEVDFSYRVGRRYKMFIVADAGVKHLKRLEDITFSFSLGKMEIANRIYFVAKSPGLSPLLCYWGCIGLILNNLAKGLLGFDRRYRLRLWGNIAGLFSSAGSVTKKRVIILLSDIVAFVHFAFKKALSPFFRRKNGTGTLRILVYHSVSSDSFYKDAAECNVHLDMFRDHMAAIKRSSKKIVSLAAGVKALKEGGLHCDSVAVTFDDGLRDVYDEALEVLEEMKIPATFFVVYGHTGTSGGKDGFMTWDMLGALKKKGFGIASHSYSHARLGAANDEVLEREIAYSKEAFKEKGIETAYFTYPYGFYGDFSEKAEEVVRKAGYEASFINVMGDNAPGGDLFRLKRTRVSWRDIPFRFAMKMEGSYDWVDVLKRVMFKKDGICQTAKR